LRELKGTILSLIPLVIFRLERNRKMKVCVFR
jgi:hypothetical protein